MAQTPSSPLVAATAAAATEGAARANSSSIFEQQPISIIELANDLVREHAEEYNAKLMVFQTFCAKFEEAAQQFATGPQRPPDLRHLSLHTAASPPPRFPLPMSAQPAIINNSTGNLTHLIAKCNRRTSPPPRQDLRVFIRLEAEAPARAHSGYAIRTLIREKLGAVSDKIRQVFQVRSGWAVLAADSATRDFLVEKQAEWAAALKPIAVETNKEWFTYVVSDFPKRLTDFHGNEVDSDSIVSDEIEIQTGLTPVDIRQARQFSDNPLTKGLLVSFLKPTRDSGRYLAAVRPDSSTKPTDSDSARRAGAIILPAVVIDSQFANAAARPATLRVTAPHQSSASIVWALIRPTLTSAQIGQRECAACSAGSLKSSENMSGPLVRRHTDNDTKNHSRDRIRKPSRAWRSDKTRMSHHKNDRTLVLQVQLYQEHLRASWWPRPLMLAMKQRKNPNSPDQAHRESAE
ncbi:hypothetical protein HZS61_004280 [Fusarium oxysporum f. sp. conglutinans]|uniref:Uncharacterized protein n=1 Tax=Fusarium oxysporum f. sp. conglutinans TaxID=100902 RepID=A0A8H6LCW6_FUSOX|nr:hypothetical protein HZS61_004280 [Fusarium oxysporum f. sp. conglutinans]